MPPPVSSPALVLRKFEYGETSQVLHLFTRDRGRVHVLAKGTARPRSSFGGPVDVLELGVARFHPRRDGLAVLAGFDRETNFPALRRDIRRLDAAFSVLEILVQTTREDQPDGDLFDTALEGLRALESVTADRVPVALLRFDLRALDALGLAPVLDACAGCGGPAGGPGLVLSAAKGGLLCARCRDGDASALPCRPGVAAALARVADPDPDAAARLVLSAADGRDARSLAAALLRHALDRDVRR